MSLFQQYSRTERKQQRRLEEEGSDLHRPFNHSTFYHRFFEGYSEQLVPKGNGKGRRVERTYVGKTYRRSCSDSAWWLAKLGYVGLCLVAATAFVYAYSRPLLAGDEPHFVLLGFAGCFMLLLLLLKILECIPAKREMNTYDYVELFRKLPRYCWVAAGLFGVSAVLIGVRALSQGQVEGLQAWHAAAGCLIAAGSVSCIGTIEHRAKYVITKSHHELAQAAIVIQ